MPGSTSSIVQTVSTSSIVQTVQSAAEKAVEIADPYVPQVAKQAVAYGIEKATPIVTGTVDYAAKTYNGTIDYTKKTYNGTVDYATKVTTETVEYANKKVTGTVDYSKNVVNGTVEYGKKVVSDATLFAQKQTNSAVEFGKIVVHGATTTIHANTPGPILNLVQSSLDGAALLRADPVGTVKPYVPTFVIHFGEKSYEIVASAQEKSIEGIKAASGFIVTKINGTTQYVTSVPLVAQLIDRLSAITTPLISKFGKKNESDNSVSADIPAAPESQVAEVAAAAEQAAVSEE